MRNFGWLWSDSIPSTNPLDRPPARKRPCAHATYSRHAVATEVISMGLERLHRDPAGFYREDADYFLFLLTVLQVRVF